MRRGIGTVKSGGEMNAFGIKISHPIPKMCVGATGSSYGIEIITFYR
jgi:hypothetical protein